MGGLIEDLWYLLFFKLFAVNIQYCPCKEKFADSKISGYVWTGKFDLSPDTCGRGNFCIRKEKVADSKISGYEWTES